MPPEQHTVRTTETICLPRALERPLEDVQRFAAESDAALARDLLNLHERRMEERIARVTLMVLRTRFFACGLRMTMGGVAHT